MSLRIGIVGLPNAGKSTLFNALTHAHAAVASYPFTTIDPNVGIAEVPDARLQQVSELVRPKRLVPATIEFVDIAGLVKGASQGEGLGNQFLGHIRNVDAVALVLRCFEDPDVPHTLDTLDPLIDLETLDLELTLADVITVERRLEKVHSAAKANPKEFAPEIDFMERLREKLNAGQSAAHWVPSGHEAGWLEELNLLSAKPRLLIANVSDRGLETEQKMAERVRRWAAEAHYGQVSLCAKLEEELAQLPPAEAEEFRVGLGLGESGLAQFIQAGYRLLHLITFFTATGSEEVRAWPLPLGRTVWEAAGLIHTDLQRGFIRAEVIAWERLVQAGAWSRARENGQVRLEGREYEVQDGDVIHIRFNV